MAEVEAKTIKRIEVEEEFNQLFICPYICALFLRAL